MRKGSIKGGTCSTDTNRMDGSMVASEITLESECHLAKLTTEWPFLLSEEIQFEMIRLGRVCGLLISDKERSPYLVNSLMYF